MNEAEGCACTDIDKMLAYLKGRVSDRKLRLFAVACCHRIWHLLTDKTGRKAVEVAERLAEGEPAGLDLPEFVNSVDYRAFQYIDGFRQERELNVASYAVYAAYHSLPDVLPPTPPDAFSGWDDTRPQLRQVPWHASWAVAHAHRQGDDDKADVAVFHQDLKEQVPLLRDVFGPLPFRAVVIDPELMAWNEGIVVKLAQGIYTERAFNRMPILADALEEAGWTNADILNHCRQPGEHVRGCWLVDLLTGRN